MKIVVDTNVVVSGVFFGGFPRKVVEAVSVETVGAYATKDIIDEYNEVIEELISRGTGKFNRDVLAPFIDKLELIESISTISICRDPDDDKFLACAKDSKALYIVSGDKDLLDIGTFEGIDILTARDFCEKYLSER